MQGCTESYDDYQDTMGEVYKHTTEQLDEEKLRIYHHAWAIVNSKKIRLFFEIQPSLHVTPGRGLSRRLLLAY